MICDLPICLICLRADRKLNDVDKKLTDFHDDMCEYSENSSDRQYCWECEYRLRKSYSFKNKCKKANEILRKWKNMSDTERPLKTTVHKLLPQTLDLWSPSNNNVHKFSYHPNTRGSEEKPPESTHNSNITHINLFNTNMTNTTDNLTNKHTQIKTELSDCAAPNSINAQFGHQDYNEYDDIVIKMETRDTIEYVDANIDLIKNPVSENDVKDDDIKDHDVTIDHEIKTDDENDSVNCINDFDNIDCVKLIDNEDLDRTETQLGESNIDCEEIAIEEELHATTKTTNNATLNEMEDCPELNSYMQKAEYLISQLKMVSKDVETIFDTHEKMLPKSKRRLLIEKSSRVEAKRGLSARNVFSVGKMRQIGESMNKVIENAEAVLKKMPIDRERCKAGLISKFEACGELKTKDGGVIDKQFILSCLDDKVSEYYCKLLWKNLREGMRNPPSAKEIQLYNVIQNKYKETKFNSIFEMEYLNSTEKILEEFDRRKSYDSYVNAEFKCDICHQCFRLKSKMAKHMKQHDDVNAGDVACLICKLHFKDKLSRWRHLETHKIVYKCKVCPMITHYRSSMVKHYSDHIGVRSACEVCHKMYKNVSLHRIKIHKRDFSCTTCGAAFFTEDKLNAHTKKHSKQPASDVACVKCDRCELAFESENARQKHVKMSHSTPRWLRAANGTSHMGKKIRTSYARRQITCEVCNTSGRNYWWMVNHAKKEHPNLDLNTCFSHVRKHLCHLCGAGFSNKYYLRDHMKSHGDMAAAEAIPYTARQ